MEILEIGKGILLNTACGVKDCIVGTCKLYNVINAQESIRENAQHKSRHTQDSSIKWKFSHCVIFGVLFWISNYIFNEWLLKNVVLLAIWLGLAEQDSQCLWWLQNVLYGWFFTLWILPVLFISKLLNLLWYQDIADIILVNANIKRNTQSVKMSISLADQCKSFLLQVIYCCVQGYVIYLIPFPAFLQNIWYLCHLALLSSLYAFEYKWVHMGILLNRRLLYIDRKWPYYLGFGLPLALITMASGSFVDSMIVFATLFPVYIISSANVIDEQSPLAPFPLHTFKLVDFASDAIISFFWNYLPLGITYLTAGFTLLTTGFTLLTTAITFIANAFTLCVR